MKGSRTGFTLIELLIVIAIFGIVLAGTSQMVVSMLSAQRQQSKIAETNIEGIVGLELMRQDLAKAGYGLPWHGLPSTYTEASGGTAAQLNDAAPNPPRGIVSKNFDDAPDYLVVKAANVATNSACNKWAFISPANDRLPSLWSSSTPTNDNFASTDRIIIITPGSRSTPETMRTLVTGTASFFSLADPASTTDLTSVMTTTGIEYGIHDARDLVRPFNRADYYVAQSTAMPQRCAIGTGILYKAVLDQTNPGTFSPVWPLLDCVADMQVIFRFDPAGTGASSLSATNDISTWTADQIRTQVKEVRVYILAHEGQRDDNFTYSRSTINVGEDKIVGSSFKRSFDLTGIQNWQHYRWKIYTLVVKLDNLGFLVKQ